MFFFFASEATLNPNYFQLQRLTSLSFPVLQTLQTQKVTRQRMLNASGTLEIYVTRYLSSLGVIQYKQDLDLSWVSNHSQCGGRRQRRLPNT